MVRVWDLLVRIVHWSVALLVIGNFLNEDGSVLHRYEGYLAVFLVTVRLCWGFVSSGYARFSRWWPGFRGIAGYLRVSFAGNAPRDLGINPAGAAMAVLIWTLILSLGFTGWLLGTDTFWGEDWLEDLHGTIAYILLACVGLHITAVIAVSIRHHENLPKAMLTGKKRER